MAKFLVMGSYSAQGVKGVIAQGGTSRVNAIKALCKGIGGKLESCYFAMGEHDIVAIGCDNSAIETLGREGEIGRAHV